MCPQSVKGVIHSFSSHEYDIDGGSKVAKTRTRRAIIFHKHDRGIEHGPYFVHIDLISI